MAFVSHGLGFGAQQPRQSQYPIFQQPIVPVPPYFLTLQQVHPAGMMMAHVPLIIVVMPVPLPLSILPPGAPSFWNTPRGLTMRILLFGHTSDGHVPSFCVTNATYSDPLPGRDALLSDLASWAGHHGLSIRHAGGRIDPLKVRLYVLPRGSPGGGIFGFQAVPGAGLVMPGDVIKVVRLEEVEERHWEEALRDIRREGYEAVVAVDMSGSTREGSGAGDLDATMDATPTPAPAADADREAAAST
ncbi:hypothetical protein V8C37DRAFT_270718 [Trichoderma ceciliae]